MRLIVLLFSIFLSKSLIEGGAATLDMDTLGYFLYMDSLERQQKDSSPDLFGDSGDSCDANEDDENE